MGKEDRRARINKERCKGCLLCAQVCPAKIIKVSDSVNHRGERYVLIAEPDKCTACGLCAVMCPDCAIDIS